MKLLVLHVFGQRAVAAEQPSADVHQLQLISPFVLGLHTQDSCLVLMMLLVCCSFVASVLSWLINPIVLGSVILFVGFWLLITRGQLKRYYTESSKLKEEFDKYRREMQVKVELLPLPLSAQHNTAGTPYPVQLPFTSCWLMLCTVLCCAVLGSAVLLV